MILSTHSFPLLKVIPQFFHKGIFQGIFQGIDELQLEEVTSNLKLNKFEKVKKPFVVDIQILCNLG